MTAAVCPWCSASLTEGATECPSCGANLVPEGDPNVPGVTAVDAASILRSKATPPPRNRLLSWISGEYPNDLPSKTESQAIAPPDPEVRREILRLELEAEVANLQAEADALLAEAAAEGRAVPSPETAEPSEAEAAAEPSAAAAEPADETAAPETEAAVAPAEGDDAARAEDKPTA